MTAPTDEAAPEALEGPAYAGSRPSSAAGSAVASAAGPALATSLPAVPGYSIIERLGSGPGGSVYRATDGRKTLALKIFPNGAGTRSRIERFLKGSPQRIRHPSLVSVEAVGETPEGRLYCAMPLLQGDSLDAVLGDLKRGSTDRPSLSPLSVGPGGEVHPDFSRRAAELFAAAAEGLAAAHREGITHGRLSPRNLVLTPANRIVITGLGGVPHADDPGAPYRAPEDVGGGSSKAGDVHALGAILYEVLTRRLPFAEDGREDRKGALRGGRLIPPRSVRPEIPVQLEACVLRAMAPDPADRYRDAGELAADLKRFCRNEETEAYRTRSAPVAPAPTRRESPPAPEEVSAAPVPASATPLPAPARTGWLWKMSRRPAWRRVAAAALLGLLLLGAWWGGKRVHKERTLAGHGEAAVSFVRTGEFSKALGEAERLVALDPGDGRGPLLSDYAKSAGALSSLERAIGALERESVPAAAHAVSEAAAYRPEDSELRVLVRKLSDKAATDPLVRDLSRPDGAIVMGSLARLAHEISSGARPRDDARYAARLLHAADPRIVRSALRVLSFQDGSAPIIHSLPLEAGGPQVTLDGETFSILHETLQQLADPPAMSLLCGWDLDLCEILDGAPRPSSVAAPPNLTLELDETSPRDFRARWIRLMAGLDAAALLDAAPRLARDEELVECLIQALARTRSPDARFRIASIARESYLVGGHEALEALAALGEEESLIGIARSELPVAYREMAIDLLGREFSETCIAELQGLALRSPEPSIRRLTFLHLSLCDDPTAARIIVDAVDDLELKDAALAWLSRLSPDSVLPTLFALLSHPDARVRSVAVEMLRRSRKNILLPLTLRLLSPRREARESAMTTLLLRDEQAKIPQMLPLVFHTPQAAFFQKAALAREGGLMVLEILPRSTRRLIDQTAAMLLRTARRAEATIAEALPWSRGRLPALE